MKQTGNEATTKDEDVVKMRGVRRSRQILCIHLGNPCNNIIIIEEETSHLKWEDPDTGDSRE